MSEKTMSVPIKIDFVSDISCPWCAIGLKSLEQAIDRIGDAIKVDLHFQPFELNPQMPAGGQDATEHLVQKYGSTAAQLEQNRNMIRTRGAELGFTFNLRNRIYNTFDAHRLLHWAAIKGSNYERELKHALLRAYFTDGEDVSSKQVLTRLAGEVGLDVARAQSILDTDEYAETVRQMEKTVAANGIRSVPAIIFNNQHMISGGQPVDTFEQALRQIAGLSRV